MTTRERGVPRRLAMPAAALIGALALAGCSSGNIGESWQCPLAKGGSCESVAAADPAVPDMGNRTVLGEPLWQVRESAPEAPPSRGPGQAMELVCDAGCGGGFDPLGWLFRLFGGSDGGSERAAGGQPEPAPAAAEGVAPADRAVPEEVAASPAAPDEAEPRHAEPAAASLPAEAAPLQAEPASPEDDPVADDLRTGEVVARIWIAPFVDAGGVYREASHVRVVLEPAGWRLK